MVRHLYAPLFVQLAGSASPAPNLPFRVYTDLIAGSDVTSQLVTPVDQTAYTAITDSQGNIAPFRGPDGYMGSLFADTGAAYRFEFNISPTLLDYLVTNAANGGSGGSAVTSVSGRTGDVTVTKLDVGLGNVANIAPADMPVSTATQSALAGKPDDIAIVHKAGAENITGVKTYTVSPVVPNPVNPTDVANKAYVDANVGTGGGTGGAVSSVAGRTGAVTLTKSDVGLANVDNTADINKPLSTAVQNALALKAPLASPTFTGTVTVPTPVNATDAATRAFVLANAGGGSGTPAPSVQRYEIPASQLTAYPRTGTDAQKLAAITACTNVVRSALINNPGKTVVLDPSDAWPIQVNLNEFNDTSLATGQTYALAGRTLLVRGTKTSSGDTTTGRVVSGPVLEVIRRAGGPAFNPVNLRNTFQLGPNNPNTGSVFTGFCSAFEVATGYAQFQAGDVYHLSSKDAYDWSARAGYAAVYKAAMFPVAGLSLNVTGYSLTALNTALGNPTAVGSMERRTVVGATSGAVALVQGGDFGTSGQIVVNSVSKDFTPNETLRDQATNANIGTYVSTSVLMSGTLNTSYSTEPTMRLMTRSGRTWGIDVSGLSIEVEGSVDDVVAGYNRTDAIRFTGCMDVNVNGLTIGGSYAAGLVLRSCYNVQGLVNARFLANHAIETDASEGAYGYCVRLLGATQNFGIGVSAEYARHASTTNGFGGTWNLNARTGSSTGSASLSTNFWNHGPGGRLGYFYGKAINMLGTGWDTHEGAEDIVWVNPIVHNPMSAARNTTAPDGMTLRGFNLTVINPWFKGVRAGFSEQAIALGATGLVWTNRIIGGLVDEFQYAGYYQSEDADADAESRFVIEGTTFRGDPSIGTATYAQAGMILRRSNTHTRGVRIEAVNSAMVRHTSFVGSGSTGVGRVTHDDITLDWTDSTATRAFSVEADFATIDVVGARAYVNPVAGTQKPFFWFTNTSGNTTISYRSLIPSFLSVTTARPGLSTVTGGTPTFTRILDLGETSSAAPADTTPPTVPSSVTTSNVSSTGFTVGWNVSTDAVGVAGYEVQIGGTPYGTTSGTSLAVTGRTAATTYSVQVRAFDAAGNYSALSTAATVTTSAAGSADTIAPTTPTNVVASNVTSTSFSLAWTASTDNVAVTGYSVQLNGATYLTTTTNSASVSGLSPSTVYSVRVTARDAAGNFSGLSTVITVTTSAAPVGGGSSITHGSQITAANTGHTAYTDSTLGRQVTDSDLVVYTNLVSLSDFVADGGTLTKRWFKGGLIMDRNNVTMTACRFDGVANGFYAGVHHPFTLNWCTIDTPGTAGDDGVHFQDWTAYRCRIGGNSDGAKINGNCTLTECYVRCELQSADDHNDGLQSVGGYAGNSVTRCNIDARPVGSTSYGNAAIFIADNSSGLQVWTDNYLAGGQYTVCCYENATYNVQGNWFLQGSYQLGPAARAVIPQSNLTWGTVKPNIIVDSAGAQVSVVAAP